MYSLDEVGLKFEVTILYRDLHLYSSKYFHVTQNSIRGPNFESQSRFTLESFLNTPLHNRLMQNLLNDCFLRFLNTGYNNSITSWL